MFWTPLSTTPTSLFVRLWGRAPRPLLALAGSVVVSIGSVVLASLGLLVPVRSRFGGSICRGSGETVGALLGWFETL